MLNKTWCRCDAHLIEALPGQLGVFELADRTGDVIYIGCADAGSLFGLRSAVAGAVARLGETTSFRVEITTAYHTRWQELLMLHNADFGALPRCNEAVPGLGRLSPAGAR